MNAELYEHEKINDREKDISSRKAFARLLPLLKEHKGGLVLCLFLLAGATMLSLYWPILLRRALDVDIAAGDLQGLLYTVAAIGLIQVTTMVIQYTMRVKLEIIGQEVMLTLKRKLYHHILSLDVSYFDKNPVGRLMARVESDTEALRMLFTNTAVMLVGDAVLLLGIYSVLFYTEWRLALPLFATLPIIGVMVWIFHRKTTPRFLEVRKKMAEVTAALTEFLHGMSIIQIFHRGAYARYRVFKANEAKFNDDVYVNIGVIIFFNSAFFLEYVKIGTVLVLGPILGITYGSILMFIVYIWRSFEPIWRTSEQLSTIQKAIAGSKRIFALLAQESRLPQPEKPVAWEKLEKGIKFEDVSFSYNDDGNYALKDATFEIPVGKRVALVGVTGGGKSTVISLLLRLYDPQKGRITVDGHDIRDMSVDELRSRLALVLQDIVLFPGRCDFEHLAGIRVDHRGDGRIVGQNSRG